MPLSPMGREEVSRDLFRSSGWLTDRRRWVEALLRRNLRLGGKGNKCISRLGNTVYIALI